MTTTGAIIAAVGAVIAACGIAILAIFGSDGVWTTDRHMVASTTPALVSSSAEVRGIASGTDFLGHPSVRVNLTDGRFVGVGRTEDVERYLAGTSYDEVTDIEGDPFELERTKVNGTRAADPPAEQSFWIEQGTKALRWKVTDGDYRIVIMSADGYSPLVTTGTFGLRIPKIGPIGAGLGLFGALWIAVGAGLAVAGRRPVYA
jgi:hypothetical protein